ncbi:hypothetical protein X962_1329 [Burkholderia pseudomallei MSHR7343]|nr:hypothetical protein X962_1329 [Burkholderia pseudomallei MSHR7343]
MKGLRVSATPFFTSGFNPILDDRRCLIGRGVLASFVDSRRAPIQARGSKALKRAPFLSAFAALRDPVSRACYSRKIRQGERHDQALIALALQRCDDLAMLRDGTLPPKSAPHAGRKT